jgi:hypothetical protein
MAGLAGRPRIDDFPLGAGFASAGSTSQRDR